MVLEHHGDLCAEQFGQERGLIETALPLTRGMQGDRNDQVEMASTEARIAHGFTEPGGSEDHG